MMQCSVREIECPLILSCLFFIAYNFFLAGWQHFERLKMPSFDQFGARKMYSLYIEDGGELEVNVDGVVKKAAKSGVEEAAQSREWS